MPSSNIQNIITVASRLSELGDKFVFLGGACVDLFITDITVSDIRPSLDVDTVVQVSSLIEYSKLEERLRDHDFKHDTSPGAPKIRWIIEGIKLDIIPTNSSITGFNVRWLNEAIDHASSYAITDDMAIDLIAAPYFLAAKLEAFHDRGKGDFIGSEDIEDIIAVFDGRTELIQEVQQGSDALRKYLSDQFATLLSNPDFLDAVAGNTTRNDVVVEQIGKIVL